MNRFKRIFLPHRDNDYTPDLLQRAALIIMMVLVVFSFTMSNLYALLWQGSTWLVGAVLPAVIVTETNKERDDIDLPALVRNPVLDEAARMKAEDMAKNSYFAHYSPKGVSPWHWFQEADYAFVHAGENLAVHFTDSKEVVDAWMKSPTHRANIVNGNFKEIGVGTAKGRFEGYDTVFVVQLFGTPALKLEANNDLPTIAVVPEVSQEENLIRISEEDVVLTQVAGLEVSAELPEEVIEPVVPETVVLDHGAVLYSDTIATSTNLPEAAVINVADDDKLSTLAGIATSPSSMLQRIYLVLGVLAIMALTLSVVVEWRFQRPRQVIYGVLLLCLMSALFYTHTLVTGGSLIV